MAGFEAKEQMQLTSSELDRDRGFERDLQVTALGLGMKKSANVKPAKFTRLIAHRFLLALILWLRPV
jgi:hypothetical protein